MRQNDVIAPSVYLLRAPDGEIGYVGATRKNSTNRRWEHICRARSGHPAPVYEWMRAVGPDSVEVVDIAFEANDDHRRDLEAVAIAHLLAEGHPLANAKGRDGVPDSHAPATRARLSQARRGKSTWIKGKRGLAARWTPQRREQQAERIRALNSARA